MPKYPKTTKIELWRDGEAWQDEEGTWHNDEPHMVTELWTNLKGDDFRLLYQMYGRWAKPTFDLTITRPKTTKFVPTLGDHIAYGGEYYIIRQINHLTGQPGRDMRVTCELDADYMADE